MSNRQTESMPWKPEYFSVVARITGIQNTGLKELQGLNETDATRSECNNGIM